MCYTAILPTTTKSSRFNQDLMDLTYIFNRWAKMLTHYGKLDEDSLNDDFTLISRVLRDTKINKTLKQLIVRCRDQVLFGHFNSIVANLTKTLKALCLALEDGNLLKIKEQRKDQGMTEKYRPLTKRLAREKIRNIGIEIMYTDSHSDDAKTTRLVRRIVEKRAAQAVHKNQGHHFRETNSFRQNVRRATSFSLYNITFTEYDAAKRVQGTHWKVLYRADGQKVLKRKHSYNSYDIALDACRQYEKKHPEDSRPITPYKCEHCGKWHIGHLRDTEVNPDKDFENCEKIA